ncbi:hypothetical protein Hanom_Chr08g00742181 [Helianthus anomalus]
MTKMMTRSSPSKDHERNSPPKSRNLLKEPSFELCRFTDLEIDQLHPCFPEGTIFRPFDSGAQDKLCPGGGGGAPAPLNFSMRSVINSTFVLVCFLAAPFQIGYTYPFPTFTQSFFTHTGLCYSHGMPMLWRVLYTLEQIISKEGLSFGLTELHHMYNLVSHGSHRFLLKAKPQHPLPLLKTTKNDTNWKKTMTNFASLRDTPATAERVAAFWALDTTVRTFQPRVKDLEETTSASYTMSSKYPYIHIGDKLN